MRGRRDQTHGILYQGYDKLNAMYYQNGKGRSKHGDKIDHTDTTDIIYSAVTHKNYTAAWEDFCKSLKTSGFKVNGHFPRSLEEAAQYMPLYVDALKTSVSEHTGKTFSAWTIRMRASGVAKVLGVSAAAYDLPARRRRDITRSRGEKKRDKHFSEANNKDLITFAKCTGLRNGKELQQARGCDLITGTDGKYYIAVPKGKGGKPREALIYGRNEDVTRVVEMMQQAGTNKLFPKVHNAADIHALRAVYARNVYASVARPLEEVPPSERYYCRKDKAGICYDKKAMEYTSKQLGHNRIDVIAQSYL